MICNQLNHVGNHLQSSAMSAADVADFLGISDDVSCEGARGLGLSLAGRGWFCDGAVISGALADDEPGTGE